MAVYKVPQDVEAEDKLIGPFSFRQFVFLLILVGFLYFGYLLLRVNVVLVVIPLPFVLFFAALAFPWRKDQPTEVYLTALIHFWTKPRKRIWNQEGHVEHVQITVPKKVKHQYTDGLSNNEVRSRLHSLASTLDTRGWDSKHLDAQAPQQQGGGVMAVQESDRLVMPTPQPQQATPAAIAPKDDVMDAAHNPIAQNFDNLVNKATEDRKSQLMAQMQQAVNQSPPTDDSSPSFNPYPEMQQHVINPGGPPPTPPPFTPTAQPNQPVDPEAQSAILNLANNSDLNVSTIARQAEQAMQSGDTIELH